MYRSYACLVRRYRQPITTGLLWNVNKPAMQAVSYQPHEIAAVMNHRNVVAAHLAPALPQPPPPIKDDWGCARCPVNANCAVIHKV